MTLTKRIIPCLDVKNGRVVKGLNFESIKDAGDPVELAAKYSNEGADELVFLDITASNEQRETIKELVRKVASVINIPFTVGGGVKSIDDARNILLNGADKVGVNTSAIKNPTLITEATLRTNSLIVSRCSFEAVISRNTSSSAPSLLYFAANSTGSPASFMDSKFNPLTTLPFFTSKHGIILLVNVMIISLSPQL